MLDEIFTERENQQKHQEKAPNDMKTFWCMRRDASEKTESRLSWAMYDEL